MVASIGSVPGIIWLDNVMRDYTSASVNEHKEGWNNVSDMLGLTPKCEEAFANPEFKTLPDSERFRALYEVCGGDRIEFGHNLQTMTAMDAYVASAEQNALGANLAGTALYVVALGAFAAGTFAANSALAYSATAASRRGSSVVSPSPTHSKPLDTHATQPIEVPHHELPVRVIMGSGGGPMCIVGPCPGPTRAIIEA